MFVGQYHHTLDAKKRLVIPAKFRLSFPQVSPDAKVGTALRLRKKRNAEEGIFVNLQTKECLNDKINFLVLYSQGEWEKHLEWLSANSLKSIEADWYLRKVSSDTEFCKIDIQWRLLIPFRLIRSADLKRDIIIVGVGNRIEVWDSENWGKVYKWLETQSVNMEKGVYKP